MPSDFRTRSRSPRRCWHLPNSTFPRPTSPASVSAGSRPSWRLARQRAAADDELKKTTAAIQRAVEAKDFKEAYRVRTALLNAYPQFSRHDELTEAVAKISAAEQAAVAWVAKQQPAGKVPAAGKESTVSTVIVAQRKFTASPPGVEGHVIFAAAAGAVYGLEAGSGKVLWRTFVGFDPDGRDEGCTPVAVEPPRESKPEAQQGLASR